MLAALCLGFMFLSVSQTRAQSRGSRVSVDGGIKNVERDSDRFRTDFRKFLNNSRWDGTDKETQFNDTVADLETEIDQLRRDFNRDQNWWDTRRNMRSVLNAAKKTKKIMNNNRFGSGIEGQWRALRNSINRLAYFYELNDI
jgi:hypothetical protein